MPAPPTRPRLRERYDRRREAVQRKAARAFAERGYHATSMNDLVEATELAAGGLYHYIGNKEKLLVTIFERVLGPLADGAEEIAGSDEDARRRLRGLLRLWMQEASENRYEMIVLNHEWHSLPEGKEWKRVRAQRGRLEDALRQIVNDLSDETGVPRNPQIARMAVLAMVNYTPLWFDPEGPFTADEIADSYCELIAGRTARRAARKRVRA